MNVEKLSQLLKKHPDIDVCMNRNGVKLGFKGTDQIAWKRFGWPQLTLQKLTTEIEKLKSRPTKESPRLDIDDEDDESSASTESSESLEPSPRGARRRPARQAARRKSLKVFEEPPMTIQEIFSVPDWALEDERRREGVATGANIQKKLRQLGSRSISNLKDFVKYAQKEGYVKAPTVADVGVLVDTWQQQKKQKQESEKGKEEQRK